MAENTNKKLRKAALHLEGFRQKLIVRVWNLAKRLNPRTMKEEAKKKKGQFNKLGNK